MLNDPTKNTTPCIHKPITLRQYLAQWETQVSESPDATTATGLDSAVHHSLSAHNGQHPAHPTAAGNARAYDPSRHSTPSAIAVAQNMDRARWTQQVQYIGHLTLIGQLTAAMMPAVNTSLQVMSEPAGLLTQEFRGLGLQSEIKTVVEHTERLTQLFQEVLTFVHAQNNPRAPLMVHEPLAQAMHLVEQLWKRDDIRTVLAIPTALPPVWGVTAQLAQVFLNILCNAWDAMPAGGALTIKAEETDKGQVRMTFRDTGIGMSTSTLAWACEPFYTTKGTQGTGFGLTICQQILHDHDGALHLESMPGVGTTVDITLPQLDASAASQ